MLRLARAHPRTFDRRIELNGKVFDCWHASTYADLCLGLMEHSLEPRKGCLLDFGRDSDISLWMKNCLHDLCACFIDKNGIVRGKVHMSHKDPYVSHRSPTPCRFALEILPEEADTINIGDQAYWINDE